MQPAPDTVAREDSHDRITLALGALLTCAAMSVVGIRFNFANIIVIPLLLGIGVDSSIHLVHRADVGTEGEGGLLGTTTAQAISVPREMWSFIAQCSPSGRPKRPQGLIRSTTMSSR